MPKIRVTQIRKGKRVTFLTPDKGKPGKTPKEEQWFERRVETGWEKEQPPNTRRAKVLRAHKGDELSSAKSMQALSNVSTDVATKRASRTDALYFYRLHRIEQKRTPKISRRRSMRITPKTPRLAR